MTGVTDGKLSDITPDANNANLGTQRGLGMLESSLRKHGAGRSILLDRQGRIIAGNKTVEQAGQIGLDDVIIVKTDGTKLVAVQREDLDLADDSTGARELAYADNRVGELDLSWNPETILADLESVDLSGLFREDELSEILGELGKAPQEDPGGQVDKAAELQAKWGTSLGQIWELGGHRLACGDCTDRAVVEAVMRGEKADTIVTDPPYNVDKAIWDMDILPLLKKAADLLPAVLLDNGVCFWFSSTRYIPQVIEATSALPYRWMFIWYPSNNMAHGDLGFQKFTAALVLGKQKVWRKDMQDLREIPIIVTKDDPGHPTPKPLELISYIVEKAAKEFVFDGFLGSGTTLIACEQLGRKCRGIEIDPGYIGVTLERWHTMTGKDPVLTNA